MAGRDPGPIASSLMIKNGDFEYVQFNQFGGIDLTYELFGGRRANIMEELNARMVIQATSSPDVRRKTRFLLDQT